MDINDIMVIMDNMKPVDRFVFGVKYLWESGRSKITGKDTALPMLQAECAKQAEKARRIDAGDFQI